MAKSERTLGLGVVLRRTRLGSRIYAPRCERRAWRRSEKCTVAIFDRNLDHGTKPPKKYARPSLEMTWATPGALLRHGLGVLYPMDTFDPSRVRDLPETHASIDSAALPAQSCREGSRGHGLDARRGFALLDLLQDRARGRHLPRRREHVRLLLGLGLDGVQLPQQRVRREAGAPRRRRLRPSIDRRLRLWRLPRPRHRWLASGPTPDIPDRNEDPREKLWDWDGADGGGPGGGGAPAACCQFGAGLERI